MRVRLARPAFEDLTEILDYLAARSPQAARGFASRVDGILSRLSDQPRIGMRTNDSAVRRIVVTPYPYLVFYEVTDAEVLILAIRHGARDPDAMPGAGGGAP